MSNTITSLDYAIIVREALKAQEVRVNIIPADEGTLGKRIRNSEKQKTPYMLVVGDKEAESKQVNVRSYHTKAEKAEKLEDFVDSISQEILERSLPKS